MTHLPDPAGSRAVLVGVSRYERMPPNRQLPTVSSGLTRLAELLCDERVWGLPQDNCMILHEPANSEAVIGRLRTAAEAVRDTLIFYYGGHGLVDPALSGGELHLALPQAYEPGGTHLALSYAHVRREFNVAARGVRRVVILDCCWSGLAVGEMGSHGLSGVAAIEGTAVLTATAATKKALAPPDEQYPAFTGLLIDVLDRGIAGGARLLDLATIYRHLDSQLAGKNRPRPQLSGSGEGAQIPLAWNVAWREPARDWVQADVAERMLALRRAGRYDEADQLQRRAAEAGEVSAMKNQATELRRSGRYEDASTLGGADKR
jgi:hypothetical protein